MNNKWNHGSLNYGESPSKREGSFCLSSFQKLYWNIKDLWIKEKQ